MRAAPGASGAVNAAVTATDGRVYASSFTVAAAPAPVVSFSKEIAPLFRTYGCNGCHGGSGGLTLGAQAFNNIVNKPRAAAEMPVVTPLRASIETVKAVP